MVFKKAIIQVFSGHEPFGFDDFVRGTLRLFNYAIDHNIDVKINVSGSEFEPYMIVNNYKYDSVHIRPRIYYMNVDQEALVKDLDVFMASTDSIFVVTSNVYLERADIYNLSYLGFDTLVRYKDYLYVEAQAKVQENLLYRAHSDNLLYGYSIIYIHRDDLNFNITLRNLVSLANQIRRSLDMNKDIMLFSNSIQLRKILSQYIEMNAAAAQQIDDSDVDIGPVNSLPGIRDIIIDFIVLLKSKKIYRFSDHLKHSIHSIKVSHRSKPTSLTNVYESAFDINSIVGNLEVTLFPLYYGTYTLAGYSSQTVISGQPGISYDSSNNPHSLLHSPSGIAVDYLGNVFFSDTANHRICKLDTSGNLTTYAGSSRGISGYIEGPAEGSRFNSPTAVAVAKDGTLYVADTGNNAIRIIENNYMYDSSGTLISRDAIIGTLVGNGPVQTVSGIGSANLLTAPRGVAVDSIGCVYISDTGNHRVCKVTSGGKLETLAGCRQIDDPVVYISGFVNGQGEEAAFYYPAGLCVDLIGNVFVADSWNNVIRRITPSGKVSTVAGSGQRFYTEGKRQQASFNRPTGIAVDLHNVLYVTDAGNNVIRRITNEGNVIPVVGSSQQLTGSLDGFGATDPTRSLVPASKRATFSGPIAIAVDSNRNLYVADTQNNTIRKIVPTFSTPVKIKAIAMQDLRITHSPGVAYTLGPTLSAQPAHPNTMIYGHKRGSGMR